MSTDHEKEVEAYRMLTSERYEDAARLFEPLAKKDSVAALLNLGWMHNTGRLGAPNKVAAVEYWMRAANKGSPEALYYLGCNKLENGDANSARDLFMKGAQLGQKSCIYRAGKMLVLGEGGFQERDRGMEMLQQAADSGHHYARRLLLGIEYRASRSIVRKIALACMMISHTFRGLPRYIKNPNTDDVG